MEAVFTPFQALSDSAFIGLASVLMMASLRRIMAAKAFRAAMTTQKGIPA